MTWSWSACIAHADTQHECICGRKVYGNAYYRHEYACSTHRRYLELKAEHTAANAVFQFHDGPWAGHTCGPNPFSTELWKRLYFDVLYSPTAVSRVRREMFWLPHPKSAPLYGESNRQVPIYITKVRCHGTIRETSGIFQFYGKNHSFSRMKIECDLIDMVRLRRPIRNSYKMCSEYQKSMNEKPCKCGSNKEAQYCCYWDR